MIEANKKIPLKRQCLIIGIPRGSYYRKREVMVKPPSVQTQKRQKENNELSKEIIEIFALNPSMGTRQMTSELRRSGYLVNRKRVKRLMRLNNLMSCAPGPHTSTPRKENKVYPYLLKDAVIEANDEVWSTDITYVKVGNSFMYLTAIIDWYSRFIVAWELSNTLDSYSPLKTLQKALATGRKPMIFNTDQGCQFTSDIFTAALIEKEILISMDAKGRAIDNIFIERFWRTIKYEWLHQWTFENGRELHHAIEKYITKYNHSRSHQSIGDATPAEVYLDAVGAPAVSINRKYKGVMKTVTQICDSVTLPQKPKNKKKEKTTVE